MKRAQPTKSEATRSVLAQTMERYLDALLAGDADFATSVVDAGAKARISVWDLYLHVFGAALSEIGERWKRGEVNVAQEHLATQITLQQMARLRLICQPKQSIGAKAIFTCVAGNPHLVGAQLVADFFYYDGWDVDFLGADMPSDELVSFMHGRGYTVLGLSCSLKNQFKEATKIVKAVRKNLPDVRILLGGLAVREDLESARRVGADWCCIDAVEAVQAVRSAVESALPTLSLDRYLMTVGSRVQHLRKSAQMSQQELAHAAALDRAYLSSLENGKQNVSLSALYRLAKGLGVSIDQLLLSESGEGGS